MLLLVVGTTTSSTRVPLGFRVAPTERTVGWLAVPEAATTELTFVSFVGTTDEGLAAKMFGPVPNDSSADVSWLPLTFNEQ